jgi:hypothetical protein
MRARMRCCFVCARAWGEGSWTQYVRVGVKKVQGAEGMGTRL